MIVKFARLDSVDDFYHSAYSFSELFEKNYLTLDFNFEKHLVLSSGSDEIKSLIFSEVVIVSRCMLFLQGEHFRDYCS